MNSKCLFLTLALLAIAAGLRVGGETAVYSTGFDFEEGYRTDLDLASQNGWTGSGGNGVVTNRFEGLGQQAYIGYSAPPGDTNSLYYVYYPVNLAPIPASEPLVKFSVMMQIVDSTSTNGPFDDFRWSVYNTNGMRLFSVDFDNASLQVSYILDNDAGFVSTNTKFETSGYYELGIAMNFARNLWTATLNDLVIVNAQPITTVGSPLNLGDVDAIWSVRTPGSPGDNFMLFDNYTIATEALSSIPPRLEPFGLARGGAYSARLYGEPGLVYRVEASADLVHWETLLTFTAPTPGGILDFQDPNASHFTQRFYRARQAP
jgi:hypothetical protein